MSQITKLQTQNFILNGLVDDERQRVANCLAPVDLPHGLTVYEAEDEIEYIYFPNNAVISVVSLTEAGDLAEAGLIGPEGMSGIEAFFDGPIAINRHIVQLPGDGYRAPLADMRKEFALCGNFHAKLLLFTRSMLAQISQTTLCNRMHVAEQRLAKWLLMCHDRAPGDILKITQEFAALMLGSNRVTLTQAAGQLQDQHLIEYRRGNITVLNRKGLEKQACECYARIKTEYERYRQAAA